MNMEQTIIEVPIEDIIPNRFQPRLAFNEQGLKELSDSIRQHGIIQPLVLRKLGDKYEIIAGERRYKAASMAGLAKVPAVISNIDDNKSAEVALVENIQRRNLTAIEEAKSYKNLLDRGYLTQEQLANKMGVSQSAIANKLRLLNLADEVQDALLNEKISERHARALLSLPNKEEQIKWLNKIIAERMTVRQLDMELKKLKEGDTDETDEVIPLVNLTPDIDSIVNKAEDINPQRELHDVASMLIPEGGTAEVIEEKQEPKIPETMPNKFFNFLEDEAANMNVEEIHPTTVFEQQPEIQEEPQNEVDNIETLDMLDSKTPITESKEANETIEEQTSEQAKSFFFQPNNEIEENSSINETTTNNTIEEIEPVKETTPFVNPMDSVDKLDPNFEQKQEEQKEQDLKTIINRFREQANELNLQGVAVDLDEADLENEYQITIKIHKNND